MLQNALIIQVSGLLISVEKSKKYSGLSVIKRIFKAVVENTELFLKCFGELSQKIAMLSERFADEVKIYC